MTVDTKLMHPREQIVAIIGRIYERSLTTTSGGNISIIDDSGDVWVTPSAVDKGSLRASDIILVKRDGTIEGKHKPSSEYPFHKAIFESRPDIKAIIHAHPPALVSFSIVRRVPNPNVISQARQICGTIGYADYEIPGSKELGQRIGAEFSKGYNAVIMENHGTVVGGTDINDAFQRFETFEFCARTIIYGQMIGEVKYLNDEQIQQFDAQSTDMLPEMEQDVEYPSDERHIRRDICRIVQRACQQGLMVSSYGTVSVRWRANDFLITPTNVARWNIKLDDIVQIRNGRREPRKNPSRITWLHQEIYNKFPHINSIILTQPPYLMAFGASRRYLDVRTIPESWIFLQDVPLLPFGSHFRGKTAILDKLTEGMPALIIENDSILVTGNQLLQTFDRLEVAEFSAKSLVMASSIGQLQPINQTQIEDLRKVFF